jgi:hypothetical protein
MPEEFFAVISCGSVHWPPQTTSTRSSVVPLLEKVIKREIEGDICDEDICDEDICDEDICDEDICDEDICDEDICDEDICDEDIWNAVFSLISLRATTPTVVNKAILDTPFKSNSSSQQGSEQTHDEIDPRILQEINDCVYKDTKGFYRKYFEGRY